MIDQQLREAIVESGHSSRSLAEASGVDRRAIDRFLAGVRDLTLASAAKIAEALNRKLIEIAPPAKKRRRG